MEPDLKKKFILYLLLAALLGIAIGWIDTTPNWDDTAISVFLVLTTGLVFGFLAAQKPWLIALAVSIWIPLLNGIATQNFAAFLVFIPGFAGAYAGYFVRKMMHR